MNKAALYLRSSKDRSDVSIDAQRRELKTLADDRGLLITEEYTDIVESAKSENRPGFQNMVRDLKSTSRGWNSLLMVDTSRLSRRQYVAQVFKHECKKRSVDIVYSKIPDVDPITSVLLNSALEAMDEVHSLMSKQKGLAGMAENIRKGYRAGGRAPSGYRLKRIDTGAVRDGENVTKTLLELTEEASWIGRYLKARAQGTARAKAKRDLNIALSPSTLIDMEWNALTYAGHTVWNVRNEKSPDGGYVGGKKRKPRAEWLIQENTHEPLITTDEAGIILSMLESSIISDAVSAAKSGMSSYLLTGLLRTPDGTLWSGAGKYYRAKGKQKGYINRKQVDRAVTSQLIGDMESEEFIHALTLEAREYAESVNEDPVKDLRAEIVTINNQISRAMDLSLELDNPAPALRKVNELEARRKALAEEISRLESDYSRQAVLANITENQVREILTRFKEDFDSLPAERWKDLIRSLVKRIELDQRDLTFRIHYKIAVPESSLCMASPRGVEPLLPG